MKVRYHGPNIGIDGLIDGHEYEVAYIDEICGYLAIIDESGEDYLYHPLLPQAICGEYQGGRFEIVEDNETQDLLAAMGLTVDLECD